MGHFLVYIVLDHCKYITDPAIDKESHGREYYDREST